MQPRATLQSDRLAQVALLEDGDVERLVEQIRRADSIPKLEYHLARHGRDVSAGAAAEYLRVLQAHRARRDLRVFTYLRTKDRAPTWELIAPDDGTSAMYHEERRSLWSFFRPIDPDARMISMETWWIEAIRSAAGWHFEERWRWKR
jgi:hypothetical protein